MGELAAAGPWVSLKEKHPPLHTQVLVRQKDAPGFVADVACFVGQQPSGELRWIMADIRLESRQLTHWAELFDVPDEVEPRRCSP